MRNLSRNGFSENRRMECTTVSEERKYNKLAFLRTYRLFLKQSFKLVQPLSVSFVFNIV